VGAVLERLVIRWLYGRPLETLLATWGISLVLMQGVRSLFGAQNVPVENPAWMSGGIDVMSNLTLPYNRIAIIAFAFLVLGGVALLIAKTRLGLFVRGVTQNRRMAACMGVNTARIDTYAFAWARASPAWPAARSARSATSAPTWARATSWTRSWWWCWAAWASWPAPSTPPWAWAC
jgi:branched-subunit amino acid ABC-type transport system permease component